MDTNYDIEQLRIEFADITADAAHVKRLPKHLPSINKNIKIIARVLTAISE